MSKFAQFLSELAIFDFNHFMTSVANLKNFKNKKLVACKFLHFWHVNFIGKNNATFKVLHYRRGYVAMSNSGEPDTNASQAVVLFYPTLLIPFEHNVWKRFYGFL